MFGMGSICCGEEWEWGVVWAIQWEIMSWRDCPRFVSQSGRRGRGGDDTLANFDMRKDMGMGMDTACSSSGGGEHTDAPPPSRMR